MRNIKNIKIRLNKVFKSFISIGLALSLVLGTVSVSFAEGDASAMNTETVETSVLSVEDNINVYKLWIFAVYYKNRKLSLNK